MTTTVPVAHGIYPGPPSFATPTFSLQGFSGSGNTGYNGSYTPIYGTAGTTLVGTKTGTCPANSPDTSSGQTALSGTGQSITFTPFTDTSPFTINAWTGVTTNANDKFCAVVGEYGADSPTPGVQFFHGVNQNGTALTGAPAVPAWPNQGAVSFTGYVNPVAVQDTKNSLVASVINGQLNVTFASPNNLAAGQAITGPSLTGILGTQVSGTAGGFGLWNLTSGVTATDNFPSSNLYVAHQYAPALTVTSMNSVTITGASWTSANNGTVTFTAAANWVLPGTVFTVSGMNPSAYNGTYIAGVGTNGTGTTIAAVSWPVATKTNPGSFVSGGSFVGTIYPGMFVLGAQPNNNTVVSPLWHFWIERDGRDRDLRPHQQYVCRHLHCLDFRHVTRRNIGAGGLHLPHSRYEHHRQWCHWRNSDRLANERRPWAGGHLRSQQ